MSRTLLRRAGGRAALAALVVGATLAGVAGPPPASAATLTVGADADARVSQKQSNSNYGHASELSTVAAPSEQSYIRFRVSGTGGSVSRAVVRLFVTNGPVSRP